jgi:hypothetical protein
MAKEAGTSNSCNQQDKQRAVSLEMVEQRQEGNQCDLKQSISGSNSSKSQGVEESWTDERMSWNSPKKTA